MTESCFIQFVFRFRARGEPAEYAAKAIPCRELHSWKTSFLKLPPPSRAEAHKPPTSVCPNCAQTTEHRLHWRLCEFFRRVSRWHRDDGFCVLCKSKPSRVEMTFRPSLNLVNESALTLKNGKSKVFVSRVDIDVSWRFSLMIRFQSARDHPPKRSRSVYEAHPKGNGCVRLRMRFLKDQPFVRLWSGATVLLAPNGNASNRWRVICESQT